MRLKAAQKRPARTPTAAAPRTSLAPPRPFAAPETVQRMTVDGEAARQGHDLSRISVASAGARNRTGLPDRLKTGIERLSGVALDDVRVHRNSPAPAAVLASAAATSGVQRAHWADVAARVDAILDPSARAAGR